MASVPRITRPEGTLRPAPSRLEPVVSPFAEAAAPVAGALGRAANIMARERALLDETRVDDALVQLDAQTDKNLLDPTDGFLNQQGLNADQKLDSYRERVTRSVSEIETGLSTDEQKALFRRGAASRVQRAMARGDAHVSGERAKVKQQTFERLTTRDLGSVGDVAGDDLAVQRIVAELAERTALHADHTGLSPEAAAQAVTEIRSRARIGQVEALANAGAVERASDVLKNHGDQFTSQDRERAEQTIRQADIAVRSQKASADLILAHADDEAAAVKAAREQYEGQMEDETVRRIEARFADQRRLRDEADRGVLEKAMGLAGRGSLESLSPADRLTLQRKGWLDEVERVALARQDGRPIVSSPQALETLQELRGKQQLHTVVMDSYRGSLDANDFRDWNEAVEAAKVGRYPTVTMEMADRYLFAGAERMGMLPGKGATSPSDFKGDQEKRWLGMRNEVRTALDLAREEKQRNLSTTEIEEVTLRTLAARAFREHRERNFKGELPGGFQAGAARLRELEQSRPSTGSIGTVPAPVVGQSRRDRYLQLLSSGMSAAEAEAQTRAERPTP